MASGTTFLTRLRWKVLDCGLFPDYERGSFSVTLLAFLVSKVDVIRLTETLGGVFELLEFFTLEFILFLMNLSYLFRWIHSEWYYDLVFKELV